jgi:hypothetical protein
MRPINNTPDDVMRLVTFCHPEMRCIAQRPPKDRDSSMAVINLRKEFDRANMKTTIYSDFDEFMEGLAVFVPFDRWEEGGIYTNLWYSREFYTAMLESIKNRV